MMCEASEIGCSDAVDTSWKSLTQFSINNVDGNYHPHYKKKVIL